MWENEFEKKVHQKMDGFKLRPASAVWEQVERRIRKEKKRRFIFWWLLVPFLLIGGIGAGLWYNNQQTKKTATINTAPQDDKAVSAIPSSTVPPNTNSRINDSNQLPVNTGAHNNDITINPSISIKNNSSSDKKATPVTTILNAASRPGTSVFIAGEGNRKKAQQKKEKEISARSENSDVNMERPVVTSAKIVQPNPVTEDIASSMVVVSPPAARIQKDLLNEKAVLKNDSNSKEPVKQLLDTAVKATVANSDKEKKGWRWGISIATGRSATVSPIGFGAKKLSVRADALGTPPFQNANASVNAPSGLRYGSSFNAGAFVQKQVSKKGQVQINAGYSYLSARMDIGKRIDSVRNISNLYSNGVLVNNFYRPVDSSVKNSYNSQYHFLYLSANFSWRIINGKKFKMDWKNGIQYSQLFGSTMLHYDNLLPGYYQDDNRLVKSQVSVSTGLLIPLTDRLTINPLMTYSLTPVLKKTSSTTVHYTDFGIRLQFLLNKN